MRISSTPTSPTHQLSCLRGAAWEVCAESCGLALFRRLARFGTFGFSISYEISRAAHEILKIPGLFFSISESKTKSVWNRKLGVLENKFRKFRSEKISVILKRRLRHSFLESGHYLAFNEGSEKIENPPRRPEVLKTVKKDSILSSAHVYIRLPWKPRPFFLRVYGTTIRVGFSCGSGPRVYRGDCRDP